MHTGTRAKLTGSFTWSQWDQHLRARRTSITKATYPTKSIQEMLQKLYPKTYSKNVSTISGMTNVVYSLFLVHSYACHTSYITDSIGSADNVDAPVASDVYHSSICSHHVTSGRPHCLMIFHGGNFKVLFAANLTLKHFCV